MAETVQLDLDVVLPHAHDGRDRCAQDLVNALCRMDGVSEVHVIPGDGYLSDQICLHVEAGSVSVPSLTKRVQAVGATVSEHYGHLLLEGPPVGHAARAQTMGQRIRRIPGVLDGVVSVEGITRIEFDSSTISEADLLQRLGQISHGSHSDHASHSGHDHSHTHNHGSSRVELGAALASLAIYVVARSLDWFTDIDQPVTIMYIAAAVLTGVFVCTCV